MEALVPALVAALLAGIGDRPAWLAARLSDRYTAPGLVLGAVMGLHIAVCAAMAIGGWLVAPILTPNARALLIAVALAAAGLGALLAPPPVGRVDRVSIGRPAMALLRFAQVTALDRTAFLTFAFAARGPSPVLAAIGGMLGATGLAVIATTLGEREWRKLPLSLLAMISGAVLVFAALVIGAGALRLI